MFKNVIPQNTGTRQPVDVKNVLTTVTRAISLHLAPLAIVAIHSSTEPVSRHQVLAMRDTTMIGLSSVVLDVLITAPLVSKASAIPALGAHIWIMEDVFPNVQQKRILAPTLGSVCGAAPSANPTTWKANASSADRWTSPYS